MTEGLQRICEMAGVPFSWAKMLAESGELQKYRRVNRMGQRSGYRGGETIVYLRERYALFAASAAHPAAPDPPRSAHPADETISQEVSGDCQTLVTRSHRIRTLEDALAHARVDRAVWEVERYTINSWEMGFTDGEGNAAALPLWQVKAFLRRRIAPHVEQAVDALAARVGAHAPVYHPPVCRAPADPHLLELCLFDHHFGKYAWARESGENYDLRIAEELYAGAVDDLLAKAAGFALERILLPIGQDFLHIDNLESATTKGTVQDADGRLAKVVEVAQMAVVKAIDRMLAIASVEVVSVPGNHDRTTLWHTARFLQAWYRHCDSVTVDAEPTERKYTVYGNTLLGYTHGDEEKHDRLPIIMATERPQEWAATRWHEWHIGHLHKRRETQYVGVEDHDGVIVRILPTLTARDKWHYQKGYHSVKVAEANLYSRERGPSGYVCTTGGVDA